MAKFQLNHTLLFVLITAFLSMQSATAHIHLSDHQNHNNNQHHHDLEIHAHQSIEHHTDVIQSSHQTDSHYTVELDHEFNEQKLEKPKKPSTTTILPATQQLTIIPTLKTNLPNLICCKFSYFYYATTNPRAPPKYF